MVSKLNSLPPYYDTPDYTYHIFLILSIVLTYFNCYDVTDYRLSHSTVLIITMKLKIFNHVVPSVVLAVVSSLSVIPLQPSYAIEGKKFYCSQEGGVPVTIVNSDSQGPKTFIKWIVGFKNFTPARRCEIVSEKLNSYHDNGRIYFKLPKSLVNGQKVICITNTKSEECSGKNVLVTLERNANSQAILEKLVAFRNGASNQPLPLSGVSGCQSLSSDRNGIYLDIEQLVDGINCGGNSTQLF